MSETAVSCLDGISQRTGQRTSDFKYLSTDYSDITEKVQKCNKLYYRQF